MGFTCPVCESSDYDELDGLFFCKTCNTQSQEIHVQEATEVFHDGNFMALKKIRKLKQHAGLSRELGRPWTIYEGYQCIILAQCDALISLGAKKDLTDIVFLLWANYLSKLKIAFCPYEKVVPDIVTETKRGRQRELHRGTIDEQWNKQKHEPGQKRDIFYGIDQDSLTFIDEDLGDRNAYLKATASMEWMDLKKTLHLCFCGLRFTNPEILPVQFVRWIYEGKVPFISTTHLLSADMVLSGEDQNLFQPVEITTQKLISEVNKMRKFLKMNTFPTPSMKSMIDQLVDLLYLPSDLKKVCEGFYSKMSSALSKADYMQMDFAAVQYIALTLKMIFGLDDKTESVLSDFSQEVQKLVGSDGNIFIWNEWRSFQMEKMKAEFDAYQESEKKLKCNYTHFHQLLETYHNFQKGSRNFIQIKEKCNDYTFLDNIKRPLEMALAGHKRIQEPAKSTDECDETIKQKFTACDLSHLVDAKAFEMKYKDKFDKLFSKRWAKLSAQRDEIGQNLVYRKYSFDNKKEVYENRPNSYLWLLELLTSVVGCNSVSLDVAIIRLQNHIENKLSKTKSN